MARRAFAAPFVLVPLGVLLVAPGCTQDFSTFDPTGSGGSGAGTPSTTSSSTDATSSSSSSTSGPGGGEGGSTSSSGGGQGGVGGQGGTGGGECQAPVDCDDDNACTTDTCEENACVHTPVLDGPLLEDPNDCRTITCAAGVVVDVANDAEDPPDSEPPCTLTICSGGAPTDSLLADGTSCGPDPQFCESGVCTGCDPAPPDTVEECGPDTACSAPACVGDPGDPGQCVPNFLPANTNLPDPIDGDCQDQACTGGSAAPVSVADNTDTPADLPCGDRGCNGGAPTTTTLADGVACLGQAGFCDGLGTAAGNCRTCRDTVGGAGTDPGCVEATPICDETENAGNGACFECQDTAPADGTDLGCPAAEVCDPAGAGNCVNCYTNGGVAVNCGVGQTCLPAGNGTCVDCSDLGAGVIDAGCTEPLLACNTTNTTCVECRADADCRIAGLENPNGRVCNRNGTTECGCTVAGNPDSDCVGAPNGPICTGNGGTCTCDDSGQCTDSPLGSECLGGSPRVCGCTDGADCMGGDAAGPNCSGGVCGP